MAHFRKSIPSLSALLALEAAARHRSITLAAAELGVTQAAVSRQISALETELGHLLFHRRHRAIEPTAPCLALTASLAASFTSIHQSVEQARASGADTVVTIGTTLAFSTLWLMPRLRAFRDAVPMAQVRVVTRDSRIGLEGRDVDVVVRFGIPPFADGRVVAQRSDVLFPVCSPGFAERLAGESDSFIAAPADLIENDVSDRQWYSWSDWFARIGVTRPVPAPAMRFNHYTDAIEAARAGQGVALGWHTLCERFVRDGSLVRLGRREVIPEGTYNVLLPAHRRPDAAGELAAQWLADQLSPHTP
jgi:DNA-binding transcriptional LysR family regulator